MYPEQDYRDNPLQWSLPLGRIWGVRIRVHLLFILWTLYELFRHIDTITLWAVIAAFFFAVILLHELGHCWGARQVGGHASEILMWPLGGLATVQAPMNPRAQFITTLTGPAVNVAFCFLTALGLLLMEGRISAIPWNPLNPFVFSSVSLVHWTAHDWLRAFWSVNYIILLFNLLPTFPMDGGRILHAILWGQRGFHQATLAATFIGMAGAIVFGLAGLVLNQYMLIAIAMFGYVTCWQHRQMLKAGMLQSDEPWADYFEPPLDDPSLKRSSWWNRWKTHRQAKQLEQLRQKEQEMDQQIDAILEKVHVQGLQSLTSREKKMLARQTERKKKTIKNRKK